MIPVLSGDALRDLRVLVLEDEFLIAMDVEQICRDHGAGAVSILRDPTEADALDIGDFDVAVVDVLVGGRSALGFASRLQAAGTPFIFASAYGRLDGVFDGFPKIAIVGKPYAASALVAALVEAVARRRG